VLHLIDVSLLYGGLSQFGQLRNRNIALFHFVNCELIKRISGETKISRSNISYDDILLDRIPRSFRECVIWMLPVAAVIRQMELAEEWVPRDVEKMIFCKLNQRQNSLIAVRKY